MCGFSGFIASPQSSVEWPALLNRMGDAIAHRGPDDFGVWVDTNAGIGIVHRRLSVVDLSPAGHQPMASASGRYVLAFNGEIYNHQELRDGLQNCTWRGHSDTETLLAGFQVWGIEATLKKCVGMFAIALWDQEERVLTLARDRMGEKPLYYGWQNGVFLFGSELKALRVHPAFVGEINRDTLALQLRHNYIPTPYSIYKDIAKLPPGTWLRVDAAACSPGFSPKGAGEQPVVYWSLRDAAERGQADPFVGSDVDAVAALEAQLRESVGLQMVADVPLGAFLSGGVDSTTIVALMQAQSTRPVKTFTIGFQEKSYNEAEHALAVARHLGTEHTELYVSPRQALEVIPRLPALYDEPFSDSSQIPTFLVSQMARQHVTVSLSGDGGDELFGGYGRYFKAVKWRSRIPHGLRYGRALGSHLVSALAVVDRRRQDAWQQLADLLAAKSAAEFYRPKVSHWKCPSGLVIGGSEQLTAFTDPARVVEAVDFFQTMMALDAMSYLPDDILVKIDRAAMGVSLETRVPMLDHRVVEFAWRLPLSMKIRHGQGKWILRQVLNKYVPKKLIERPKMGFGVPIDIWLRGPLRDWAEALLDESRLRQEGYFHPEPIRQKWSEHLAGQRNWQYHLWDVLMFQAWLEQEHEH